MSTTTRTAPDMTGPAGPRAATLVQHRVYAFATSRRAFDRGVDIKLPDLLPGSLSGEAQDGGAPVLPDSVGPAIRQRYAGEPVWVERPTPISGDLLVHAGRILSGARPDLARRYVLSDRATALLRSADLSLENVAREDRVSHRLALLLSARGAQRIAEAIGAAALDGAGVTDLKSRTRVGLELAVRGAELLHFRTDVIVGVVEVEIRRLNRQALSLPELQEALASLGHVNELAWLQDKGVGGRSGLAGGAFALGDLFARLLDGGKARGGRATRTYLSALCGLAGGAGDDELGRTGVRLARHYTDDYAVATDPENVVRIRHFENVGHWIAREGSATLVDLSGRPGAQTPVEFLRTFRQAAFERHYLPIAILNQHELRELLDIKALAAGIPGFGPRLNEALATLEVVRDRALRLRLGFRFGEVSAISMHNHVHAAFRSVLGLQRTEDELARDVTEINGFLRDRRSHSIERRFRIFGAFGSAFLAAALAFGLATTGNDLVTKFKLTSGETIWLPISQLAAGIVGFALGFVLAWARQAGHSEALREEAEHELILSRVERREPAGGTRPRRP